jgi:hypothetical protein
MAKESEAEELSPVFKRLRWYNAVMGVFHLAQGGLMIALSNDATLPVTTSFLEYDAEADSLQTLLVTIGNLRIAPLVAVFLLISAAAHFIVASPWAFGWYVRNLKKKINYVRWYEYALSSSIMIVLIAMLSGMYDLPSLILLFALNATMNLFGLMMELHNQTTTKTNWTAFVFGCFAGIVPWAIVAAYFLGSLSRATETIPTFVYFILVSLLLLYATFPINMVLQYKKVGRWRDYLFGERVYVLLSLVAKSALAWQVFGGALAASEF